MFQITLLFLYLIAAGAFVLNRLPQSIERVSIIGFGAFIPALAGVVTHAFLLLNSVTTGGVINLSLAGAISLIGLQLALIAVMAAINPSLRGVSAGLLVLAAPTALAIETAAANTQGPGLDWQIQAHVLTSIFAYGLLSAGAIVAIYALIQDRRLRTAQLSSINQLFAPLETTEKLLYGVTAAGFGVLALSIVSGITFIEDLFAQHLVHKTVLSLLALLVFGILLAGRHFAGWRGKRAVQLYLGGFALLCLAYFGSRIVLEQLLDRSWG